MPKPTSKAQLFHDMEVERQRLEKSLTALSDEDMMQPGACGDWAIKDVLTHLFDWEQRVLGWYEAGLRGELPHLPAPGFNWGQLPLLNQQVYEKHRNRALDDVLTEFDRSYRHIRQVIDEMPEEEMFAQGRYPWAGKWTLAQFFASSTSSHYRWARKLVRDWTKSLGKKPL
jgi:hypothetical protein